MDFSKLLWFLVVTSLGEIENISFAYIISWRNRKYKLLWLKANISWRNRKYKLRLHYDEFQTDAERKKNLPIHLRREDWENFVGYCSTEEDQAHREKGKSSREKMKTPHTSGRRGAARIAEELEKESSSGTITRAQLYLATHTKKDGTCSSPPASQ